MRIVELFDSKYVWSWVKKRPDDYYHATFKDTEGKDIDFYATLDNYTSNWEVVFRRGGSMATTGQGDAFKIFSTIADILTDFIKQVKPKNIEIIAEKHIVSPKKVSESRIKLYIKGLTILSNKLGYTLKTMSSAVDTKFFMRRNNLTESFDNDAGGMSPLTYQGDDDWRNEKDFFKKWFSRPFLTNGWADQSVEEDTTRTTKKGGQGTLKSKVTKKYGGKVTCSKAKQLKSRKNATAHDKSQANWFLNMNCKGK